MVVGRSSTLEELFSPSSIAVIGASNRPGAVGERLFRNLLAGGYQGVVYPVNPAWKSVSAVKCYGTVAEIPETPELGVVIVPAPLVAAAVDQLGRRGTHAVIVISAGFREVGARGGALEDELIRIVRRHRMSIVGPNCFGVINTDPRVGLNATFSGQLPPRGNIAFVSQSGALCAGILQYGISERIGFSRFVSMGNRAGVDENDLLRSLKDDDATKVILLYVESLADGRRFLETAKEITETKPVLVIKSGRSPAGERAVLSHTGSLAQSSHDRLYDALFAQAGVIRSETIGDLFRAAKVFTTGARLNGPRLVILTNSGGPGIVAADACARNHLDLPVLGPRLQRSLAPLLTPSATLANPLDVTADPKPEQFRRFVRILLASPEVDGTLVITTPFNPAWASAVANAILEGRGRSKKPVVACLFGLTDLSRAVGILEDHGVPTFTFPEEAIQGLGNLQRYHAWRVRRRTKVRRFDVDDRRARSLIRAARRRRETVLPEYAARSLLEAYGIPFPAHASAGSRAEALRLAEQVGYPLVLKAASPDISHKTDVGAVALHIGDAEALGRAWDRMERALAANAPTARIEGFEIQEEVATGKEVLVGGQRDPNFGPMLVFGMGGIYVEVLQDVTFRLAPIVPLSAENMVASIRSFPLLCGVRGEAPSDLPALYETLERISQLVVDLPEVVELDINPLIVRAQGEGAVAVDARVVLARTSTRARRSSPSR
jgi:acetyltransferase